MNSSKRIVKIIADILALVLIVNIFSVAGTALLAIVGISQIGESVENISDEMIYTTIGQDISEIDLDIASASVYIKSADSFTFSTNDKGFSVKQKKNKLKVEEKNLKAFSGIGEAVIVITVPQAVVLDLLEIESGAGALTVEGIACDKLEADLGFGEAIFDEVNVNIKADIDSGAGNTKITNSVFNNLSLSAGVGKTTVSATMTGINEIESGIGNLHISNNTQITDYSVSIEPGLGKVKVGGEEVSDDSIIGTGKNVIKIEGGIGNIEVDFAK